MAKVNNFPQQTHFIGVLVPDDITLTLEDCRRYMKERYGCRSGFQTPIHVTLVPPFHLNENYTTDDLMRAIENDVVPFANRDIPDGVVMDALKVMNEMELVEDFEVNNVTVFERRDGRWVSAGTLEL